MSKSNKNNSERKEAYLKKRKALIEMSKIIRLSVNEGIYSHVNEGLIKTYMENNPEITEFNTFWQWKQLGYTVKKGSAAFLVWGQPRKIEQTPEDSNEPEEFKYWPLCYLFANTQVIKPEEKKKEPSEKREGKKHINIEIV